MKRSEEYQRYRFKMTDVVLLAELSALELGLRWLNDRSNDYTTFKGLQESIRRDVEVLMPMLNAKFGKHVG
jgi:hypothetical protein